MNTKREAAFEERAKFTAILRDKRGMDWDASQQAYRNLRKLARDLTRHNERECSDERYCNVRYGAARQTQAEATEAELERRMARLAKKHGLTLKMNGDPRGYALRVMGLGVWNTWGGEESGYGVPEE